MKLTLYTDGGARPRNPGPSGFACVLVNEYGHMKKLARFLGTGTNNEAEFKAVIVGVKMAAEEKASNSEYQYLEIVTDSQLVQKLIHGVWTAKDDRIKMLMREAQKLLRVHFGDNWHVTQIRGHGKDKKDLSKKKRDLALEHGELNELCDVLCTNVILDGIKALRASNPWLTKAGIDA